MRRRRVVHRWPAVPMAEKAMARNVRWRSAVGQTMAALLPPSSRMARANRLASRGATLRPIAVEPVAETRGTRGLSTSCSPSAAGPMSRAERPAGTPPCFAAARSKIACVARAVSGVFSDGFQTTALPQTRASAAFHDQTATGKLKAEITPTTPSGCQVSIMRCAVRSEGRVRPASCRDKPAAKPQMSIISCTSPQPSERILPVSMVTSRPSAGRFSRSSSPRSRTSSPRLGAGTLRHSRNARCAAAMAAAASSGLVCGIRAMTSPVIGEWTARSPDEAAGTPSCSSSEWTSFSIELTVLVVRGFTILPLRDGETRGSSTLLCRELNALFENIQSNVRLLAPDEQRRTQPDAGFATAQQKQAMLERQIDHVIAQRRNRIAALLILNQFDGEHQSAPAGVAYIGILLNPGMEARQHPSADCGGVLQAFALENVEGGERSGNGHRIAAKRAGMRTRRPVHDFGARHADAQRHSRRNALGDADDVGLDAGVLDGPPLSGSAGAGLDVIGDQQNAMPVADAPNLLQENVGRDDVAAFALDRLQNDCGNLFGRQRGLEQLVFDETRAGEPERFRGRQSFVAAAIRVRIGNVSDARNERREAALLLNLRAGKRKRSHGASVKAAEEADDVLASSVIARQLQRAFNRLRAGVAVVDAMRAGHGRDCRETFGKRRHLLVIKIGAGHVDEPGALVLNCPDDLGMTVAGGGDGDAGGEVEILVAIDIFDPGTQPALYRQRIAAGVTGGDELRINLNNYAGERAGNGGDEPRAEAGAVGGFFLVSSLQDDHEESS